MSRAEFARHAGITPGAVTKACKKSLAPATIGKRIDANHPAAIAYIENRTGNTTTVNGWTAHNEAKKLEALEALKNESFADMTLREVVKKFGTDPAFSDWLKAIKLIEDINSKRIANAEKQGELVSKKLIQVGVIDVFNVAHLKLIKDGTKTIASRVVTMSGAGSSVEECEHFVSDQISSFIKMMKTESLKVLHDVRPRIPRAD